MDDMKDLFTIGEFASKAGVTLRTLRFYDKIGLLKPSTYTESGHRLYSRQDFARLQKILTLKFIGLSLEEIENVIKHDTNERDFRKSLEIQRDIINKKIHHMITVMNAIDEALDMIEDESALNWNKFVNIINLINIDRNWMEQYQNASNLRARIMIHELYSTNKYGWMEWYFEQMDIPENSRILELGCGDASLWAKNFEKVPRSWDIILTDFSQGMLKDAKKNLGSRASRFKFRQVDAEDIPYDDESFDVVIANHMLYHVPDMDKALSEIKRVLKEGGLLYASTVGHGHMKEMRDIIKRFDSDGITPKSFDTTEKFQLESGMEVMKKYFEDVKLKRYEDSLIVTEPGPLVDYIFSMPGNVREVFSGEKLNKLVTMLEDEISNKGGIYITKDTGFFLSRKYTK